MKKIFGGLFLALVLILSACSGNENQSAEAEQSGKPVLNIGYVSILANAPGIVADKKGFFSEEFEVNTYAFNSGPELYQALAAGELDVAYAGVPALVNWASRGLPAEIISKVNEGEIGVVTSEDSAVTSVSDLKGEVLAGVKSGSGVDIITRGIILPEAGLTDEDVQIQEFKQPNIEAAVESGQASAGVLNEPFLTYAKLRGKTQIASANDPALVTIATKDALNNKPEAIRAFMDVHQSTIEFLNDEEKNADKILADVFNVEAVGNVQPEEVIAKAKSKMTFEWKFDEEDFSYYQQLADAAYELGYVDQKVDVKQDLMNLSFVEGVVKE
ncbi:ABC transporter substrate-binding protein [Halobacillus yeomjeoni]|uniref:ABC transporter substrate-binding protein n=1 Tax=Halobacillus yeomjeoni TaxID=311194 RepID=A0A931MU65_9BACI|nr:ABC transporter substrate-binding protein [Halobacillus yeomjeoni]MBH0229201.1 ABC transporter substrate-binding protein [Halobacillus yeomjeoni]